MKTILKSISILFLLLALHTTKAQIPYALPNNSFEQWDTIPGYSASVLFFNLEVFPNTPTPAEWNYISLPINESISIMGMSINVNTSVPLLKVSQVTGAVPNGEKALGLQSFMLSEVVSSTAYSLAQDRIDTLYTNMVYPTILSTGAVDLMYAMNNLSLTNVNDLPSLMAMFDSVNLNLFLSGGIALQDFTPTRLSGSYKYQSAVGGDYGGVVLIGTHYNAATQRREVVGVGYNIALTDTNNFTPFEVDYVSRHSLDLTYPEKAPDSLVVVLLSSANLDNLQQGSLLVIDQLQLWQDTCSNIYNLEVQNIDTTSATLSWRAFNNPLYYEVEYGPEAFEVGEGIAIQTVDTNLVLNNLMPASTYECYVRAYCEHDVYSDWTKVPFTTDTLPIIPCGEVANLRQTISDFDSVVIAWESDGSASRWEVEYGVIGFAQGTGQHLILDESRLVIYEAEYEELSSYNDIYVRTYCGEENYGTWHNASFLIPHIGVASATDEQLTLYPNPAHGHCTIALQESSTATLRLYTIDGRLLQSQTFTTTHQLQLPHKGLYFIEITTQKGKIQRLIVNE